MKASGRPIRPISLLALVGLALGMPAVAASASADAGITMAASADSLEPTSAVPWNPSGPVPPRRGWEQAILLPGRIATLPLSGLGYLTDHGLLYVERTGLLTKVSFAAGALSERAGISVTPSQIEARTGLGATVGLRTPFLGGALKNSLRADFSLTTRQYNRTLLSVQGRPGLLQYGYDWRPEVRFYGVGHSTSEDSVSTYASQTEFVRGSARWAWNRDTEDSPPRTAVHLWGGPRAAVTRTGREAGTLSFDARFPGVAAATLDYRVEHLIYGGSFSSDWRAGASRWERGWRVLVLGERYDRPNQLTALRIGSPRGAQFTRFVYETETGFSFMRDPRSVRFLVRLMDQGVTSGGDRFLLSDMATLGGSEGLAGFEAGRFHDLDLLLTKITYIFPIVRRLEIDLHSEWGSVYSDVWGDFRLSTLRNSYGFALRGRLRRGSFGSLGMDFSREAARAKFSLGGVE